MARPKGTGKVELVCELLASRLYSHEQVAQQVGLSLDRVKKISSQRRAMVEASRARYDEVVKKTLEQRIAETGEILAEKFAEQAQAYDASQPLKPKDALSLQKMMLDRLVEKKPAELNVNHSQVDVNLLLEQMSKMAECARVTHDWNRPEGAIEGKVDVVPQEQPEQE